MKTPQATRTLAFAVALIPAAQAATIAYVGAETGGAGTGFAVENWSNTGVGKTYSVDGSNRFGGAGYYQLLPNTGQTFAEGAAEGNDLGITLAAPPDGQLATLHSRPSFLSANPLGAAGTYVNFPGYSVFRQPNGNDLVQQGALSVSLPGAGSTPGGAGSWGNAFSFTLGSSASFRLGIAVDSIGSGTYAPNFISIYSPSVGSVFSTSLNRDGTPDLALFDISGQAGDLFVAALWQTGAGEVGPAAFSLLTFDNLTVIPEPGAYAALLGLGAAGFAATRRRRQA